MDALMVGTAVVGSFIGAFAIQKAALEGLLRLMDDGRRHVERPVSTTTRPN